MSIRIPLERLASNLGLLVLEEPSDPNPSPAFEIPFESLGSKVKFVRETRDHLHVPSRHTRVSISY